MTAVVFMASFTFVLSITELERPNHHKPKYYVRMDLEHYYIENVRGGDVFLLKEPADTDEDPYIDVLKKIGYTGHCIPVLSFQYQDIEDYTLRLEQYTSYDAIIFTSQRAVHATARALSNITDETVAASIRKQRCYAVGKATGKAAEDLGFSLRGSFCGNAEELSNFIVKDMDYLKHQSVLYPCGNIRKEIIPVKLSSQGYEVQEIVVYKTVFRNGIHDAIKRAIEKQGTPSVIVFFSPSGVRALHEGGPNIQWLPLQLVKIVAFGPSTRAELERHGCSVYKTLDKPSPQGLMEALRE